MRISDRSSDVCSSDLLALTLLATAVVSAAPAIAQSRGGTADARGPVETRAPNAPDQEPAFEDQTRAPQPSDLAAVTTSTVADGLHKLWAMEFLPDGRMLVTAKKGAMHIVDAEGEAGAPIAGVPEVDAAGQGGRDGKCTRLKS